MDAEGRPIAVSEHPANVQGTPDVMADLPGEDRDVSKVFADGG